MNLFIHLFLKNPFIKHILFAHKLGLLSASSDVIQTFSSLQHFKASHRKFSCAVFLSKVFVKMQQGDTDVPSVGDGRVVPILETENTSDGQVGVERR